MILYNEFGLKGSGWSAGWNEREAADCAVRTSVSLLSAPAALIIASLSAPAVYMLWLAWYTGARCWRDSPLLRPVSPITSQRITSHRHNHCILDEKPAGAGPHAAGGIEPLHRHAVKQLEVSPPRRAIQCAAAVPYIHVEQGRTDSNGVIHSFQRTFRASARYCDCWL